MQESMQARRTKQTPIDIFGTLVYNVAYMCSPLQIRSLSVGHIFDISSEQVDEETRELRAVLAG